MLPALTIVFAAQQLHAQTALGLSPAEGAGFLHDRIGEIFTFVCPAGNGEDTNVYGTDVYTDSSPICPAAIHAGLLKRGEAGTVSIRVGKGAKSFTASTRNGVTTRGYTAWPYSYEFVGGQTGVIGWNTVWSGVPLDYTGSVLVRCPGGGGPTAAIYGTDVYTSDSAICVAAVHAGAITAADGGFIVARRAAAANDFPGSRRNGVESKHWGGSHADAFSVTATATPNLSGLGLGSALPSYPSVAGAATLPAVAVPSQPSISPAPRSAASLAAPVVRNGENLSPRTPVVHAPAVSNSSTTPAEAPPPASLPSGSVPAMAPLPIPPRTIALVGFSGTGSAQQAGPIPPRTISLPGFTGVGSAPIAGPVPPRSITLPGWTGTGSAP